MRLPPVVPLLLLFVLCGGCTTDSTAPDGLVVGELLSRGDHRFLDHIDPSPRYVAGLRREDQALPYMLSRALAQRGRGTTAIEVHAREMRRSSTPWNGFHAIQVARHHLSREEYRAAISAASRAVEWVPEIADGWFVWGEALYRMGAREELLAIDFPPIDGVVDGEYYRAEQLFAERLLWQAVGAWEEGGSDSFATFLLPFTRLPAAEIHSRLYLYLFYRAGTLSRFPSRERTLMEAVYRVQLSEYSEAARLLSLLPADFIATWRGERYAGVWETLRRVVRDGEGSLLDTWLNALHDDANSFPPEIVAQIQFTRSVAARDDRRKKELLSSVSFSVLPEGARGSAEMRLAGLLVAEETPLSAAIEILRQSGVGAEAYARVVERHTPALLRERRWREVDDAFRSLPDEAREARIQLAVTLTLLREEGLYTPTSAVESALAAARERTNIDFYAVIARVLAGESLFSEGPSPVEVRKNSPTMEHALVLTRGGLVASARSIAMERARDARVAWQALSVAKAMNELDHHAAGIDLSRRAVSRGDLEIFPGDVATLYPLPFRGEIERAAERFSLPPHLLSALIREESHFRPTAVSPVGAIGLTQLMPATADEIRSRMRWRDADAAVSGDNITMGAFYLDYLSGQITSPVLRLAGYNAGLGRARRWTNSFGDLPPLLQIEALPFLETRWYLRRIAVSQAFYAYRFKGTAPRRAFTRFMEGEVW